MKKLLLAALVAIASIMPAAAANFELFAGYGGYTQMDATHMQAGVKGVRTSWGAVNLGANFKIVPKVWIGPSYTLSTSSTKGSHNTDLAYHALMCNVRYEFFSNSMVTLYSKAAVGVEITNVNPFIGSNFTRTYCAFQVSPIGAQVDLTNHWAIYGEAGFGAQGLLQVGAKYVF